MTLAECMNRYPEHREELQERAGIMEYHGGMDRPAAEQAAADRIMLKYKLFMPETFKPVEQQPEQAELFE